MKKILTCIFLTLFVSLLLFANDNITFILEITGVEVNRGQIHVRIFSNDMDFRNDHPNFTFILESDSLVINHVLVLPEGEYVFSLFQDTNNNGRLDTNFLGIPREPVGISNPRRGIPGNFHRHRISVNNYTNRIVINLERV
jgi:uncharacterized protein (DUF2141 family)